MIRAGKLRKRLEIQAATENTDAHGATTRAWATTSVRWGSVDPLNGREIFEGQQVDPRLSHRIVMRHFSGFTTAHRIKYGSRIFHVHAARNIEERDRKIEVLAMEQT